MIWLYYILAVICTIFIHEAGHVIVALLCGIKVEIFSLGFGKPFISKKLWGIEFRLTPWLVGGYAKLEGENSNTKTGWLNKRYYKKVLVSYAGIAMNLLLACVCYLIMYKSIWFGLNFDYLLIKSIVIKDYESIFIFLSSVKLNLFLMQLGLLNLFSCVANALPFPALDGCYPLLFWIEKLNKKNYVKILNKITRIGFTLVMILQAILIYYIFVL